MFPRDADMLALCYTDDDLLLFYSGYDPTAPVEETTGLRRRNPAQGMANGAQI